MHLRSTLVALLCLSSGLWGGERVYSNPESVKIVGEESVIEFQTIGLKARDGSRFKITGIRAEHRLVNLTGTVGVKAKSMEFLVYLSSTMKPGHYTDTIIFDLEEQDQTTLRIPVTIEVKAGTKMVETGVLPEAGLGSR